MLEAYRPTLPGIDEPLQAAVWNQDLNEVKRLLAKVGVNPNAEKAAMCSPLNLAIRKGNEEIARLLIDAGADINAADPTIPDSKRPLATACAHGRFNLVKLLYEKGATVNADDEQALHNAVAAGSTEIAHWLIAHGADSGGHRDGHHVDMAILESRMDDLADCLAYGADIGAGEHRQSDSGTPLQQAIVYRNLEAVKCLIEKGADIDEVAYIHTDPLMASGDHQCRFFDGTALMMSVYFRFHWITKWLVEEGGADVNIVGDYDPCDFEWQEEPLVDQ